MSSDVLALPVLATWGLIDLTARLTVRVYSSSERAARLAPVVVPAPTAPVLTVPAHLAAVRAPGVTLVAAPSGKGVLSAS